MSDNTPAAGPVSNGDAAKERLDQRLPRMDARAQLVELLGIRDADMALDNPEITKHVVMALSRGLADKLAAGPWDEPMPLNTNKDLPVFPVKALPPALGEMVEAIAASTQVPVDLPAVIGLATLAGSLVGRVELAVRAGWSEPVTIYALGLIGSGNRKSSLVRPLTQPLWNAQAAMQHNTAEARAVAEREKERLKIQLDSAKAQLKKRPDDQDVKNEFEKLQIAYGALGDLPPPVLIVNDATPEALAKTMADQGGRLAMFDAEGGGLTTMVGARYTAQTNLDLMLKAHAGDSVSQVRIGRGAISIARPVFAFGVLSQPETLRELRGIAGAAERGLFARLLIAAPPDRLGQRDR